MDQDIDSSLVLQRVQLGPTAAGRALAVELAPAPKVWVGVIRLAGSLDLCTAAQFLDRMQSFVDEGWRRMVLDLDALQYVDSTGMSALVIAIVRARRAGGDVRLARVSALIHGILASGHLDRVLDVYATVEEAVAEYV